MVDMHRRLTSINFSALLWVNVPAKEDLQDSWSWVWIFLPPQPSDGQPTNGKKKMQIMYLKRG